MSSKPLLLTGPEVQAILKGQEEQVLAAVAEAYRAHARQEYSLPHSVFLRFPRSSRDRIIALPAFLGACPPVAGIKWVASFPGNVDKGMDRASAILILNSMETGRTTALMEASVISAWRTAASAALAARALRPRQRVEVLSLFGCGLINFEVMRFLLEVLPAPMTLRLFDLDRRRAERFRASLASRYRLASVVSDRPEQALDGADLVSFATTASVPHVTSVAEASADALMLHLSLRDLSPAVVLDAENIVDDPDHVCRESTSLHLAEREVGHRRFIHASLGEILLGTKPRRPSGEPRRTVFSPFGLGILDLAVGSFVLSRARDEGLGTEIDAFLPVDLGP